MRLKYNFVVRQIGGKAVAVAVGEDNAKFNGMIKLNSTGELIFECLKNDTAADEIAKKMCERFSIDFDSALNDVNECIDKFRSAGLIEE